MRGAGLGKWGGGVRERERERERESAREREREKERERCSSVRQDPTLHPSSIKTHRCSSIDVLLQRSLNLGVSLGNPDSRELGRVLSELGDDEALLLDLVLEPLEALVVLLGHRLSVGTPI